MRCTYPAHLYVVSCGTQTKIGVSCDVTARFRAHQRAAEQSGELFAPRWHTSVHREAGRTEDAIVERYYRGFGARTEYLAAPWEEVLDYARSFPRTAPLMSDYPARRAPIEQWERFGWDGLSRARILQVAS